ncbi:MAG: protein-L-isoaspartate(D-aspartate) O-methyltransferase [bacterium]|nr:protein-L-isoaspartate(D-aspartate) O-methyltransferase [bacterium]
MRKGLLLTIVLTAISVTPGCAQQPDNPDALEDDNELEEEVAAKLDRMVTNQIEARGVKDEAVLAAMRKVDRAEFIPPEVQGDAYRDGPLPIGYDQTISQPYIVAYMTEALMLDEDSRVLEIGTGSGYQVAILAEIASEVFTIEIVPELGERAEETLDKLGYDNVNVLVGDGYQGWPDEAPFDAIIVTCAPDHVPPALLEQLGEGGRLVIPVDSGYPASLNRYTRIGDDYEKEELLPVMFVPMTGEAEER